MADLGWSKEGDIVTLRMSESDWYLFLTLCGVAIGASHDGALTRSSLLFMNRINAGNPNFTQYDSDMIRTMSKQRRGAEEV